MNYTSLTHPPHSTHTHTHTPQVYNLTWRVENLPLGGAFAFFSNKSSHCSISWNRNIME